MFSGPADRERAATIHPTRITPILAKSKGAIHNEALCEAKPLHNCTVDDSRKSKALADPRTMNPFEGFGVII